jgi:hypothetical protein
LKFFLWLVVAEGLLQTTVVCPEVVVVLVGIFLTDLLRLVLATLPVLIQLQLALAVQVVITEEAREPILYLAEQMSQRKLLMAAVVVVVLVVVLRQIKVAALAVEVALT